MTRVTILGAMLVLAAGGCRPWEAELNARLATLDAGEDAGVDAGTPCVLELCLVDQVTFSSTIDDYYFDVSLSSSIDDITVLGWGVMGIVDAGHWDTAAQSPIVAQGLLEGDGRPGAAWVTDTKSMFHLGSGAPTRFTTCGGTAVEWQNVTTVADGGAWASAKNGGACRFPPVGPGQFLQVVSADAGVALVSVVATAEGAYFGADNGQIYDDDGGTEMLGPHLGTSITALGGGPGMGYWAGTDQGEVLALDAGVWGVVWVDGYHNRVSHVVAFSADDVWAATGSAAHMGTDHLWADYPMYGFYGNLTGFSGGADHLVAVGFVHDSNTGWYDAIAYRYRRGAVIP
jgi:hypothetical protein